MVLPCISFLYPSIACIACHRSSDIGNSFMNLLCEKAVLVSLMLCNLVPSEELWSSTLSIVHNQAVVISKDLIKDSLPCSPFK